MNEIIEKVKKAHWLHQSEIDSHTDAEVKEALDVVLTSGEKVPPRVKISLALRTAACLCDQNGPIEDIYQVTRCWRIKSDTERGKESSEHTWLIDCKLEESLAITLFVEIFFRTFLCSRIHDWTSLKLPELKLDFDSLNVFANHLTSDEAQQLQTPGLNAALADFVQAYKAPEYVSILKVRKYN